VIGVVVLGDVVGLAGGRTVTGGVLTTGGSATALVAGSLLAQALATSASAVRQVRVIFMELVSRSAGDSTEVGDSVGGRSEETGRSGREIA
jgi:hypothetical protein